MDLCIGRHALRFERLAISFCCGAYRNFSDQLRLRCLIPGLIGFIGALIQTYLIAFVGAAYGFSFGVSLRSGFLCDGYLAISYVCQPVDFVSTLVMKPTPGLV